MINKFTITLVMLLISALGPGTQSIVEANSLPKHRPHIRIFRNFGTPEEILRNKYDLSFYPDVSKIDPDHLGLKYDLNAYLMAPSEKSSRLKEWWCTEKLKKPLDQCIFPDTWLCNDPENCDVPEDMLLHSKKDTVITLDLGVVFLFEGSRTGVVKGWDPGNFADGDNDGFPDIDTNKDGLISDSEWNTRPNKEASARNRQEARIPTAYWGNYWYYLTGETVNHHACYIMNVGNQDYVEFMSEIYVPRIPQDSIYAGGIYFDNSLGSAAKLWTMDSEIVEYDSYENGFYSDNFYLLQSIRNNLQYDTLIIGNQWDSAVPIDGAQSETWLNISYPYASSSGSFINTIDLLKLRNSQGIILLAQYSPVFHDEYARTGPQLPVSRERDQIYALSSYYLAAGDKSYFGYGNPPYQDDGKLLFGAIDVDIGAPLGSYFVYSTNDSNKDNLLKNGGFEEADSYGNPVGWSAAEPVAIDSSVQFEGASSVRIDSVSTANNNSNGQPVTLKPYTTYTLSAYVKTENIAGPYAFSGANLYPWDFDDSTPVITGCMGSQKGTNDWTLRYCSFTTGSDVQGRISFRIMFGTGTAWFDKITLSEGVPRIVLARKYSKALVLVRPRGDDNAGYEDPVVYSLNKFYRPLSADGTLAQASPQIILKSADAAILMCTSLEGDKYVAGQDCQQVPPPAPDLVYPSDGMNGLDTTVTFKWSQSSDPDGDVITHKLSYCKNTDFSGCSSLVVSSHADNNVVYASAGNLIDFLTLSLGVIVVAGVAGRGRSASISAVCLVAGALLLSCGGGGGGGSSSTGVANRTESSPSALTYTVSGLEPGMTYYWKVTAYDGGGDTTDSTTWSFRTRK